MPTATPEAIAERAAELAQAGQPSAAEELIVLVEGDRQVLEAARDQVAAELHSRIDDWSATAALTLLNQALSRAPRSDPLDWRVRWSKHRKP